MPEDTAVETQEVVADEIAEETPPKPAPKRARDELGHFMKAHGLPDEEEEEAAPEEGDKEQEKAAPKPEETVEPQADEVAEDAKGDEPDSPEGEDETAIELTPAQRKTAKDFQFDEDAIRAMGDKAPDVLSELGSKLSRKMGQLGQLQQQLTRGARPVEKVSIEDALQDLSEDDFIDSVEGGVKKINALVSAVRELRAVRETDVGAKRQVEIDGFFGGLVDQAGKTDWPEYGLGKMADLDDDSPETMARNALVERAACVSAGYQLAGTNLSMAEALQMVFDHKHRAELEKAAQAKVRRQITQRHKAATVPPSGRRAIPGAARGDEAFNQAIDEFQKNTGLRIT